MGSDNIRHEWRTRGRYLRGARKLCQEPEEKLFIRKHRGKGGKPDLAAGAPGWRESWFWIHPACWFQTCCGPVTRLKRRRLSVM